MEYHPSLVSDHRRCFTERPSSENGLPPKNPPSACNQVHIIDSPAKPKFHCTVTVLFVVLCAYLYCGGYSSIFGHCTVYLCRDCSLSRCSIFASSSLQNPRVQKAHQTKSRMELRRLLFVGSKGQTDEAPLDVQYYCQ